MNWGHSSAKASHSPSGDQTTLSAQRPASRPLTSAQVRSVSVATSWTHSSVGSRPAGRVTTIEPPSGDRESSWLSAISMTRCSTSVIADTASVRSVAAADGPMLAMSSGDTVRSAGKIRGGDSARYRARFRIMPPLSDRHLILPSPLNRSRAGRPSATASDSACVPDRPAAGRRAQWSSDTEHQVLSNWRFLAANSSSAMMPSSRRAASLRIWSAGSIADAGGLSS